jgi:hypothetical protein
MLHCTFSSNYLAHPLQTFKADHGCGKQFFMKKSGWVHQCTLQYKLSVNNMNTSASRIGHYGQMDTNFSLDLVSMVIWPCTDNVIIQKRYISQNGYSIELKSLFYFPI